MNEGDRFAFSHDDAHWKINFPPLEFYGLFFALSMAPFGWMFR